MKTPYSLIPQTPNRWRRLQARKVLEIAIEAHGSLGSVVSWGAYPSGPWAQAVYTYGLKGSPCNFRTSDYDYGLNASPYNFRTKVYTVWVLSSWTQRVLVGKEIRI